jgi:protein SCO1
MAAQSKIWSFVLICMVGIGGIAASFFWRHPAAVDLTTGTFLTPSRELPDFSLIDQQGRTFGAADLRGHWSLMFFGYTNCPDFCPTTLTTLAAMEKRLRAAKAAVLPQVIFVSVDAKRDTPAQLAKYVPYFDPDFIGLTAADQPSIEAVAKKLGVGVIIQAASDGNYTVDHTSAIYVLNPDGRITAILTGPFTVAAVQEDFQRIVAARAASGGRA